MTDSRTSAPGVIASQAPSKPMPFDRAAVFTIWQGMQYQNGITTRELAEQFARQVLAAHGVALPRTTEEHTTVIAALNRLIETEKHRDEKLRAEHPDNPYVNLMQMEDVEQLERAVEIISTLGVDSSRGGQP